MTWRTQGSTRTVANDQAPSLNDQSNPKPQYPKSEPARSWALSALVIDWSLGFGDWYFRFRHRLVRGPELKQPELRLRN